jgi:hypothetical protein
MMDIMRVAWVISMVAGGGVAIGQPLNFIYDAATSTTLPSAQCWTRSSANEPDLTGGVLLFDASTVGETRFYSSTDVLGNDFSQTVIAEMRAEAITGTWQSNPCGAGQRAALGFTVGDSSGRICTVFIGTQRVSLATGSNPPASGTALTGPHPWVEFDATGAMRTYRLEITGLQARLLIDGVQVLSVDRRPGSPLGAWPTGSSTPNRAAFGGDLSVCVAGSSRIASFAVTGTPSGTGGIAITQQPPMTTKLCALGPTTVSISATSPYPSTFVWRRNGVPLTDGPLAHGTVLSGTQTRDLTIAGNHPADSGAYDCVVTNTCGQRITLSTQVSPGFACSLADVAGANQRPCPDGVLTADDIIVFLGWYFAGDSRADVAGPNQGTTPDGQFTADDIIVYLGWYFAGC